MEKAKEEIKLYNEEIEMEKKEIKIEKEETEQGNGIQDKGDIGEGGD
jgi:hypothetical protein